MFLFASQMSFKQWEDDEENKSIVEQRAFQVLICKKSNLKPWNYLDYFLLFRTLTFYFLKHK